MVVPLNEMEEARIRFESELAITFSIFGVLGFEGQAEGVGWCFPGLCVPVPSTLCA